MAPYRGKHRRTSADEENQVSDVVDPGMVTAPEDASTGEPATPPSAPERR